jgi:aminopeptidase N
MRWWDDLWLNEAFAEFACNWAAVRATRYTDAWASHLATGKVDAYLADQSPISHPIHQPIRDVAQAASIFDAITYPKGASVLQQLMTYVGEDRFSAGMTDYFARHQWGNTTLQDLIDALSSASGRDLAQWRTAWLETAGTDRLTLTHKDGAVLTASAPAGPRRPHVLTVGAYREDDGKLTRASAVRVEIASDHTPVDLPSDAEFVLVNDEDLTFATTRPAGMDAGAFAAAAAKLPTPIARGVAVATVWDMLVTAEISAAAATRCLLAVLSVETADSVIERYLTRACDAAERWAPESEVAALSAEVAQTCRALTADANRRRVALRAYARVAPDRASIDWLRDHAGDDVDLHWRALVRAAELGVDTADDVEELRGRDPDPDSWVRALAVQAARPDEGEKAAVWQRVAVDRTVPIGASFPVAAAFWRPGQDDVLAPYGERYIELLPSLHRGGMIPAMSYGAAWFPLFGIDEQFLGQVEAAAESAAPVVRKTVAEQADEVRRMLRARAAVLA